MVTKLWTSLDKVYTLSNEGGALEHQSHLNSGRMMDGMLKSWAGMWRTAQDQDLTLVTRNVLFWRGELWGEAAAIGK